MNTLQIGPSHAKAKKYELLTKEGTRILEEYWETHPPAIPSPSDQNALIARINALPGCSEYKKKNMTRWFGYRLQKVLKTELGSRYPTLKPTAISHLKILYDDQRNPAPTTIATWASLLKASVEDVTGWIRDRQLEQESRQRLPTPSDSTSPEPSVYSPTNDFREDYSVSPVIPSFPINPRLPYHSLAPSISPTPPPSEYTRHVYQAKPEVPPLRTQILGRVMDALNHPSMQTDGPQNAKEFSEHFAPFESKIETIMQKLGQGQSHL